MSLPRYQKYKQSGLSWLGEVPEHWNVVPFFSVAIEREEKNVGMQENNLLSLSYGRIVPKDINTNDGLLPESFETYQIVRPGDIIFRLTDLQNDKRSLRTAIVQETGIITSAYVAAKPLNIEPHYLNNLLRAYDSTKVFYSMGGGLRQSMKYSDLKRLPTLMPPLGEQEAIASFLDRETGKIDALVAEQEKLIELLKEKRQAIISHAVTKGLNPNAKIKDSGIEWLGEVPEHWSVLPIRWFANCGSGDGIDSELIETEAESDKTIPVIGGNGVMGYTNTGNVTRPILCIGRVGALCGNVHVIVPPAWVTDNALILDASSMAFDLAYLAFVIKSRNLNGIASKTAQPLITGTQVRDQRVPRPPLEEQAAIAEFLTEELVRLDSLTHEAERAIELLIERRSVLISAAVTGKIDVRNLSNAKEAA